MQLSDRVAVMFGGKIVGVQKKEEIEIELQLFAEEQEEIENLEVIKEFRSQKISLDEFLFIIRKNKEEENRERQELKRKDTNESEENL